MIIFSLRSIISRSPIALLLLFPSKFLAYCFSKNHRIIIDIGCGEGSSMLRTMRKLGFNLIIGIDINLRSLYKAKKSRLFDDVICSLAPYLPLKNGISSSVALCADVIEHLNKEQGFKYLDLLENIVERIIIITPNGFIYQPPENDNPFQAHLSGWSIEEMKTLGYKVFGVDGILPRSETGMPYFAWLKGPAIFLHLIGLFLQPILSSYPKLAFRIFCVKDS